MITRLADRQGYAAEIAISAPVERVFAALTTLDGLAGWWTEVSGSPTSGGKLTFRFGSDQTELSVDAVVPLTVILWTCLRHSKFPEWQQTTLLFDVRAPAARSTMVAFRHIGLVPTFDCYALCSQGWDHYLGSLAAYVEGKGGHPWGSQEQRSVNTAFGRSTHPAD